MLRDKVIIKDPAEAMAALSVAQLSNVRKMNMQELVSFFETVSLHSIAVIIETNQLNGSVLHMINERDIDRMGFTSLGEAKGFLLLCRKLARISRGSARRVELMSKTIAFEHYIIEWYSGPCSSINCWAFKTQREWWKQSYDACYCSPKQYVKLPDSTVTLYKGMYLCFDVIK